MDRKRNCGWDRPRYYQLLVAALILVKLLQLSVDKLNHRLIQYCVVGTDIPHTENSVRMRTNPTQTFVFLSLLWQYSCDLRAYLNYILILFSLTIIHETGSTSEKRSPMKRERSCSHDSASSSLSSKASSKTIRSSLLI